MNMFLWSIVVGVLIGIADVLPMIRLKLPRYSTIAAFIHYFVATVIIFHLSLPYLPWWLKGGVTGLVLMIPMLIHVGHEDKKPLPVIAANAVIWGTAAGIAAHYSVL